MRHSEDYLTVYKNNNLGIEACAPGKNYHAAKAEAIIKQIQRCANSALAHAKMPEEYSDSNKRKFSFYSFALDMASELRNITPRANAPAPLTMLTDKSLSKEEIAYYVQTYKPLDKAGAYGIQEWIGLVGVKRIKGSYTSVVGLPSAKTHQLLQPYLMHFK